MPKQRPGRSRQDYATPPEFILAVLARLRVARFKFDFAAAAHNSKAGSKYWSEADDALSKSLAEWARKCRGGWGWLNPPFADIEPWAAACHHASANHDAHIALLVPASVGANWYADYVHGRALVLALSPRLAFDPDRPTWGYPKDCILALYGPTVSPGFDCWRWKA
jgi:hypothetical protein